MVETVDAARETTELKPGQQQLKALLPALERLDALLAQAVAAAEVAYGPKAAADLYRGLYTSAADAGRLLARRPGAPLFQPEAENSLVLPDLDEESPLRWLAELFGLSAFDLDLILLALAPALDLRYERLYAYLQDHVSRRRPGVDLALNLLCPSAAARLARRVHFAPEAPLFRHKLMILAPEPDQTQPSLLQHYLKLDDQVVRLLLGQAGTDQRLAQFCRQVEPAATLAAWPLATDEQRALARLARQARASYQPLRLYFQGAPGTGRRATAEMLAGEVGSRLLVADLGRAPAGSADFEQALAILVREGWWQDVVLYLDNLDLLGAAEQDGRYAALLDRLAEVAGITILAGSQPWPPAGRRPLGVVTVSFPVPEVQQRRLLWQAGLAAVGVGVDPADLDALAGRFRLTPGQINEAVLTAYHQAGWSAARLIDAPAAGLGAEPTIRDLFAAARAQSGHDLARLAVKIEPRYTWGDIILPEDALAQLHEICQRVVHRHRVLGEWSFDRKLSLGKGVTALFAGPSGTGKTMAAEIIAHELGLDLYKIDLSGVVSKYIGETEKNLDRVFNAAENANAILFFDEADALFGKRSEVRDSHDRYANVEISYLLQKMEQYEGVTILATNLRGNLDEAFIRRLAFTVHFPFPTETDRRRIWTGIWPAEIPLADDVDLDFMAGRFKLSGGNIKNIALAAAYLAAADGGRVSMAHLRQATRREYQKLGKMLTEAELGGVEEARPQE